MTVAAVADGAEFSMVTPAVVTGVPLSVPSVGVTSAVMTWPFECADDGRTAPV